MYKLSPVTALLESVEGENDYRNDFMINLQENYMAELGFEFANGLGYGASRLHLGNNCRPWSNLDKTAYKKQSKWGLHYLWLYQHFLETLFFLE